MAPAIPSRCSLIPDKTISIFASIMSWAKFWSGSQFLWNAKKRQIRVTKSSWALVKFAFVVYGWLVFLAYEAHVLIFHEKPIYWTTRCFLLFMGGQVPMVTLVVNVIKERDIFSWINSVFKFDAWFSGIFKIN